MNLELGGPAGEGGLPARIGVARNGLDELCLFKRALMESEIQRLAAVAPTAAPTAPRLTRANSPLPRPKFYVPCDEVGADSNNRVQDVINGRRLHLPAPSYAVETPAGAGLQTSRLTVRPSLDLGSWASELAFAGPAARQPGAYTFGAWLRVDPTDAEVLRLGEFHVEVVGPRVTGYTTAKGDHPVEAFRATSPPGEWFHLAVTRSRAGVLKCYLNAEPIAPVVAVPGTDDKTWARFQLFGGRFAGSQYDVGCDEVAAFDAELSPEQVRLLAKPRK